MYAKKITDPEVELLATLAGTMRDDYVSKAEEMWDGSPFQWITQRPSRQIGTIGERLVSGWAAAKGYDVVRANNSDADRIIEGHRIEIKYSRLWTDNHQYKFQQIRDQDYDYVFCLGVSPFDAHAWFIPKAEVSFNRPGLTHQHGGQDGSDTRWLSFTASDPPSWLNEYGGTLGEVNRLIKAAGRGSHRGRP
jgi:hypothetical protein